MEYLIDRDLSCVRNDDVFDASFFGLSIYTCLMSTSCYDYVHRDVINQSGVV